MFTERPGFLTAGRYVEDSATTTQSKAADAAGAVKKFAESTTETAADTARAAAEKASQGATATKDAAVDVCNSYTSSPPQI